MANIAAQASQAAAQGQQMLNDYRNKATGYQGQYNDYVNQANQAQGQVKNYTNYMAGEGSGGNQYNVGLQKQLGDLGYDPAQMTAARNNLNQANGALSAYSDFANTGAAKFGLNAGGFAAANAGALSGLNNNIAAQQGVVNSLSDIYKTAQTGANQFAGQQVQSEQNTLAGYQKAFENASSMRDQAASMMNFYDQLAQQQGGLNAQQQQYYAQAQQAYAAASAAQAQAGLYAAQAAQTQQQIDLMNKATAQNAASKAAGNTGIGVLAPGQTGITRNGSVVGVQQPKAAPAKSGGGNLLSGLLNGLRSFA